ncbi:FxLYD domain-containing protein [Thermoproteota archaeon]
MQRLLVTFFILTCIISIFFCKIPNLYAQPENVEVLSYSWYVSSRGSLIVVGEVQNIGNTNLESIILKGIAYSSDTVAEAESSNIVAHSRQILPQQKVPFIMYFFPENSYYNDLNWISHGVNHIEFSVTLADGTENYQYHYLEIFNDVSYINSNRVFMVTGRVRNTGNEVAGKLWIVATFYNSTGSVIATDFSDYLSPDMLEPGETTSFTLTSIAAIPELVNEFTDLSSEITAYELVIQTEAPIIPEFPEWIILPLFTFITGISLILIKKIPSSVVNFQNTSETINLVSE